MEDEGVLIKEEEIARLGFEPRLTVPKTGVLPLHYQAIIFCGYF